MPTMTGTAAPSESVPKTCIAPAAANVPRMPGRPDAVPESEGTAALAPTWGAGRGTAVASDMYVVCCKIPGSNRMRAAAPRLLAEWAS